MADVNRRKFKPRTPVRNDAFTAVRAYLPNKTEKMLRHHAQHLGIPMSRLVAIALDNELDTKNPFNYPCNNPKTVYKEYNYAGEAGRILDFLRHFPKGTTRVTLMLCRRDMDIPDRTLFLEALRELLHTDMVEEFTYTGRGSMYDKENLRIRVRNLDTNKMRKYKYKTVEGKRTSRNRIQDKEVYRGEDDE
jgi:hypothetical protein